MKNFLLVLFLLFIGCSTPKKLQSTVSENTKSEILTTGKTDQKTIKSIDTTKQSSVETNSVIVEFYKPDEISDYDKVIQLMRERGDLYSDVGIVKRITGSSQKAIDSAFGKIDEMTIRTDTLSTNIKTDSKITVKTAEQPASDPYRWRWIALIVVVIALSIIYLVKKFK
jgi:hypothetical protein